MKIAGCKRIGTSRPLSHWCGHNGFALIEFLVVLFLMAALLMVGVSTVFVLGPKLNRSAVAQMAGVASLTDAAEQFRADVAGAVALSEQVSSYQAGPETLILRIAAEGEGKPTHLVWHWDGSDLWRIRWMEKSPKYGRLGAEGVFGAVSFGVETQQGSTRVTMQLEPRRDPRYRKLRARPSQLEIVGVLGADLR
jgi:prepilin-type N-terminal cleavage/methylation domain-containing protein